MAGCATWRSSEPQEISSSAQNQFTLGLLANFGYFVPPSPSTTAFFPSQWQPKKKGKLAKRKNLQKQPSFRRRRRHSISIERKIS